MSGSLPLTDVFAAIQEVREFYSVKFFPEDGTSPDCLSAKIARITCDNIMHRVKMRYDSSVQNSSKPLVLSCKELLEMELHKEQQLANISRNFNLADSYKHITNVSKLEIALKLIEDIPAL